MMCSCNLRACISNLTVSYLTAVRLKHVFSVSIELSVCVYHADSVRACVRMVLPLAAIKPFCSCALSVVVNGENF